ncbi:Enoyl-CoA hydratase / Delta(3)-cis-delta(2)-trans-enoyl-CoA isomerase / 3-hydroxyacyl-CoA dehydrogenase / 3-hydroxybutyryl-CoA epimerase, partial [hydrothermal vent metagenome]
MTVEIEDHKNIRILAMNDGKLNCQSKPLRIALLEGLEAAAADSSCRAVVLLGRGRVFSAGADINEFDAPPETVEPHLNFVLIDAIESMPVPVIAAIHGTAVGGGLELALGCHYRVATPNAMLGLPEVTLGLMPGAGGTQRLPRAIGLESALNLMLSGRTIPADEMPAGLVDRIVDGDLEEAALAFAREIADVRPMPLLRQTKINYPDYEGFLEFARGAAANDPRKMPGVIPVIDAVESAVRDPIEKAMLTEWQVFERLRTSAESAPFRYAFLAERKTVKIADIKSRPEPQSLKTAAVIGAGSMGAGIAVSLAEAGLAVKLLDTSAEALERGVKKCVSIWTKARDRGRIDDGKLKARIAALTTASTYEEIADCDLVVEAVLEEMPVKR